MKKFLISLMMFFIFTISAWAEESLILPSQLGIVQEIDFLDSNESELGALQLVKINNSIMAFSLTLLLIFGIL